MRKLIGYLILPLLCFTAIGCFNNRITKAYDFSGAQLVLDEKDIVIRAALLGASIPGEKEDGLMVIIRSSPYSLSFFLTSSTGYYREAKVSNVMVLTEKNKNILPKPPETAAGKFSETPAGNIARVSFNNLPLPYEKLFLTADVELLTKANSIIKQPIQFFFEPTYSEEKSSVTE
ncbi:MAG: hypothetical protein V2B19_27345 [Pseudomonadota bacterium]